MKESVLQMLDEGVHLKMAREPKALPETLTNWPPEKAIEIPPAKYSKRPLFLMLLIMSALMAFFYVKFYM